MYIPLYPTKCPTIVSNPNPHDHIMVVKSHSIPKHISGGSNPRAVLLLNHLHNYIYIYIYITYYYVIHIFVFHISLSVAWNINTHLLTPWLQDHLASVWPLLGLSDGGLTEAAFKAARWGKGWPWCMRDPGMESHIEFIWFFSDVELFHNCFTNRSWI